MDLISVIIPVYNIEQYISRCLDSVINQTYQNLEIIIIDDGSTDRTIDICNQYAAKDSRILICENRGNGISSARNTGISASKGQYTIMVDSDDYISNNMIEVMYRVTQETSADLVICDFVKGKDQRYKFNSSYSKTELISSDETLRRIYINDHNKLRYVVPWIKLYKRELLVNAEYPNGKIFEDIYTTHKIIGKCHTIAVVDDILYYYYQRPDSIMNHKFNLKKLDYLGALEERIDYFHSKKLYDVEKKAHDELLHSLLWEYSRVRDILHNKTVLNDIHKTFRKYYKKGYTSSYSSDTKKILWLFNLNPELVVFYWKLSAKLNILKKRKKI